MEQFIHLLRTFIENSNAKELSLYLTLPHLSYVCNCIEKNDSSNIIISSLIHPKLPFEEIQFIFDRSAFKNNEELDVQNLVNSSLLFSSLSKPYDSIFYLYFVSLKLYYEAFIGTGKDSRKFELVFKIYTELIGIYLKYFQSSENAWEIPILKKITLQYYQLARIIYLKRETQNMTFDKTSSSGDSNILKDCARVISRAFNISISDRSSSFSGSKKWATLHLIVILFKLYFRLNHLRLCHHLLQAIEADFPPLTSFPKSEWISLYYYKARLLLSSKEYKKAENLFNDAFLHCHKTMLRNKRRILIYLIPLKLLRGTSPSLTLFNIYYQLIDHFNRALVHIKNGDVVSYDIEVNNQMDFLIKWDLFSLFSIDIRNIVVRNLVKKIHLINEYQRLENKLLIDDVLVIFQYLYYKTNNIVCKDEVECILANLIFKGYMRGYISHDKGLVVLSKKIPFPSLNLIIT